MPVSLVEPAGSAFRARRPTIVPLEASASSAASSAAEPATTAEEAEVPEMVLTPPPTAAAVTPSPGAAMKADSPRVLEAATVSPEVVFATPTTLAAPAG